MNVPTNENPRRCVTRADVLPPLSISSVQTANDRIGYEAMKLLHCLMDGGRPPSEPMLIGPQRVVERESTSPDYGDASDVRRAREFIREHACEGINVEDVVRSLSVSRRTFEKHFAERIGHSPGQEIQRVRLDRAKKLLSETELSITQVAGMTGFSEPPRFTNFFRKHLGLSPSDFRKGNRR